MIYSYSKAITNQIAFYNELKHEPDQTADDDAGKGTLDE